MQHVVLQIDVGTNGVHVWRFRNAKRIKPHSNLPSKSYSQNLLISVIYFSKEYEVPCFLLCNFGPGDAISPNQRCRGAGKPDEW